MFLVHLLLHVTASVSQIETLSWCNTANVSPFLACCAVALTPTFMGSPSDNNMTSILEEAYSALTFFSFHHLGAF
jgi:hypothetical protein